MNRATHEAICSVRRITSSVKISHVVEMNKVTSAIPRILNEV